MTPALPLELFRNVIHFGTVTLNQECPDLSVDAIEGVQAHLVGLGPLNWFGRKVFRSNFHKEIKTAPISACLF